MNISKTSRLLKELKGSHFLPLYNEELVSDILKEMSTVLEELKTLYHQAKSEELADSYKGTYIYVLYGYILRYKRALLIYLNTRLERIEEELWYYGGILPEQDKEYISSDEKNFATKYKMLIHEYGNSQKISLDLFKDLEPPKDLYIEIRVINDCGEIATQDGIVNLEKNTTHYLRKADIESLIRQGHLVLTGNS